MALFTVGVVVFICVLAVLLRSRVCSTAAPVEDLDIYALSARYRPMLRLLNGSDFRLLNDAGDPLLARRMRSQRRAIFRGYLRSLRRDHSRLCGRIREWIVCAESDQSELSKSLFRMQIDFNLMLVGVHFRLALHAAGIGEIAVWSLMTCFEQVRKQAEMLSAPMPVPA